MIDDVHHIAGAGNMTRKIRIDSKPTPWRRFGRGMRMRRMTRVESLISDLQDQNWDCWRLMHGRKRTRPTGIQLSNP